MKKSLYYLVCLFFLHGFCERAIAQPLIINTIVGGGSSYGDGGPATAAQLTNPTTVFIDAAGNQFIADYGGGLVRKVSAAGIISTLAGAGSVVGDGGPATASNVGQPAGVYEDASGNVYIAEQIGCRIRKINTSGIISTIAGTGTCGYSGDGGAATAATVADCTSVTMDASGNIYIADYSNDRVRMINTSGTISTIAGGGSLLGDGGPATAANLDGPYCVNLDGAGTLFISDEFHDRVRQVNLSTGIITTVAGDGTLGYSGDGAAATAAEISNLADIYSNLDTLYIADAGNDVIRVVNRSTGIINTIAGTGVGSFSGDGGLAATATMHIPAGVMLDNAGNYYIADFDNARIRKIYPDHVPKFTNGEIQTAARCENDTLQLNPYLPIQDSDTRQTETWSLLSAPLNGTINDGSGTVASGGIVYTTTSTGGAITIPTSSIIFYDPTSGFSGIDSFSFVISDGVASDTTWIVVTVNPGPASITGTLTACPGSTTTLADAITGGTWSSSITAIATVGSITGVVTGIAIGTTTITYTTSCGAVTATVTVSGASVITPSTPITICTAAFTNLSDATSGGTWSSSNTGIATVTSGGDVYTVASGTDTITYTLSGGCTATKAVTVNGPAALSPVLPTVCSGGTVTITDAASSGTWGSSNTAVASISSSGSSDAIITGVSTGTAIISYTLSSCLAVDTVTITNGAGAITPAGTVIGCVEQSLTLSDATTGGTWSSLTTSIATVVASSGSVTGVSNGSTTITYTVGSCYATSTVSVIASSPITPLTSSLCVGGTETLTELALALPFTGVWISGNTALATVSATAGVVTGISPGTDTISYQISDGGVVMCAAYTATVDVTSGAGSITPSTAVSVCSGTTTALADATSGGTWSSGNTAVATVSTSGIVKGVAAGTATIMYSIGSCNTTKVVTVTAGPAAISPSSATICTSTTVSLTETTTGGTWSSSTTGTATVSSTGIVGGIAAGTTTIAYSLGTCSASAVVTVANTPAAITPSTAIVFCAATTTTLVESVTGGTWSSGATGTATVSSIGIVTGVTGGTVTISYSSGSCYVTKTVTVSPGPEALLPASPTVCTGSTLSITDAVTGGTWSSSATAMATVGSTGMASGVAPGSVNISYAIGSCVATDAVTVVETPTVGAVSGTTSLCVGATTSLTEIATDGAWSSSNSAAATVSSAGIVYGAGIGTTTISYTITSSCGVIGAALVMTVNTSPSAGTITGSASMCAGATLQLSNTVAGGSWSSSNGSASVNSSSGLVTGISPGTDTITYTITTPCGTASTTKVITIGAYLSAGTITGASILCGGATTTLTDLVTGGAWSSSNSSATVGSTGIVTGAVTGGMDTISYTVTASCGSAVATDMIDVYPTAISGTMSGVSTLCIGTSATFTETATGGVWSSHNSNATVTGAGLVTAVSAGTDIISYSVSNSCGASVATVNVTISSATPTAGAITGDGSVCAGTPVTLTDAVSDGVWGSSNTNASVSSTGMVTALASGLDTISYTLTTSCGTATATFVISANGTVPTAGTITGASGVCVGYPIAFTSTVSGGAWSISNSHATITAGLVSGVTSGTDTVTYTVSTSCGTAATTVAVTIGTTSAGAGSISGTSVTCAGSSTVLTDHTAGGAWSSSNTNATVIGGTVTGVTAGAAIISYSITYSCGIAYATDDITINPSSPISAITGPVTVCVGSTIALSDATPGGSWSSGNTNVTVSGGAVTGVALGTSSVSYTVTSSCGAGSAVSVITIVAGSTITLAPISGISIVCIGSGITLTDASPGGVWLASNAHAAVVGSGIIDGISPGIDTIGYLVAGVCGNVEVTKILSVDTIPTVAPIAGPSSQCVGSTIALSDPTAGGIWTESTPAVGTVGLSTGVVTGVSAGTTIISYTVTNLYGCPNTVTLDDAVTPSTITTPITGSASVCLGGMTTLSNATLGGAWSSSNTTVAVIGLVTGNVTGLAPGTTTIGYTIAGSCGIATITSVEAVDIFPIVSAISGSPTVCAGAATVLGDAAAGGVWSSRNTSIAIVNATSGAVTGVSGGTDEIYYLIANSCGSATDSTSITIYPGPAVDAISAAYTAVCTGNTLDISDATVGGVWVSSNTAIATVSGAGAVLGRAAGEDTIYYIVTNSRGCSSAAMASITVGGAIVSAAVDPVGAVELCNGHTVYMDVVSSGGFTYQWLRNGVAIAGAIASGYTTSATGNYSVILSNGVCSETVTGPSVITPALPVISFTPPDKLSTGTYASYQWFRNGVLITGATGSTIDETGGGVYTVVVTDAQGCTDTSSGYTLGATGVNSISAPQDIKVYPNPATSVVHIEAAVQVNVSVLSIDGKLLIQQNNATDVDVSALADGMYMILVYDQNGLLVKTAKFAKVE